MGDVRAPAAEAYPIEVRIKDYSGAGLIRDSLRLSWRPKGNARWRVVPLKPTRDAEIFVASIPGTGSAEIGSAGRSSGQAVEYFLSAADRSGRRESLPRTAPDGFYSFEVAEE